MSLTAISIFLFIVTAIISMLEKDKLFKRPISKKALFIVLLVLIATIGQSVSTYLTKIESDKEKVTTEKAFRERDSINASKVEQAQKKYDDSLKAYSLKMQRLLAEYGLRQNQTGERIIKAIDSNATKGRPFLTYGSKAASTRELGDTIEYSFEICNTGKEPAAKVACSVELYYESSNGDLVPAGVVKALNGLEISASVCVTPTALAIKQPNYIENAHDQYLRISGEYNSINNKKYHLLLWYTYKRYSRVWGPAGIPLELENKIKKKSS